MHSSTLDVRFDKILLDAGIHLDYADNPDVTCSMYTVSSTKRQLGGIPTENLSLPFSFPPNKIDINNKEQVWSKSWPCLSPAFKILCRHHRHRRYFR